MNLGSLRVRSSAGIGRTGLVGAATKTTAFLILWRKIAAPAERFVRPEDYTFITLMMGYFFYYELVADKKEKQVVATHVSKLVDHLIRNNFNMIDIDGTHTRWSVWSPDNLNRDPEWMPDRYQNSMEVLAFLKLAYYMTGNGKYQQHYLRLINEEHYLENMSKIPRQNPAWFARTNHLPAR